jgi:mono/diheme cytochrome c family protein
MGDPDELNATFPVRPNRGVNRGYQTGQLRADGTLATYTAVNSPIVYRGDRLPSELQGNVFVAEPSGNLISRIIVSDDGTGLHGRKAYPDAEFMTSTDERFRPVYLSSAPDGTMYLVDIYHGIIQQKSFITEYLRDHIVGHALEQPIHMGRIYRIVHDTTRRDDPPAMASETPAQLVAHLSHPNGWWRDTAQRLLVERGDASVRPALERLAASAPEPRTRVHALWTLQGLDALDATLVVRALADPSRDVRANAVRLAEPFLSATDASVQAAVMKRLDDPDWSVRQQLAASLGALPPGARETALTSVLERYAADPVVVDGALSGLRGGEVTVLRNLLRNATATSSRDAAITMLAATIVRGAQDQAVESVFELAADTSRPDWQRSAILRGAEVSLRGAAAPGSPRGGRASGAGPIGDVDPTARGGRNGPGGAPAFPREGTAGRGAGAPAAGGAARGGRGGGNVVRFNHEPVALSTLAGQPGELGTRAKALLARIEWPGKPGASAPVAPLTADEQRRFTAGQKVYESICQACHQEDGRGKEEVAPPLAGSALATAAATVPVRILLNGKEGTVGLMPPIGQTFTDDQIADVLTYVRRQWGNVGTPVDVQTVKDTRAAVASRTRPWTNDELTALDRGGRGARGAQQ